jgi:predicted transposase YbfD/YdcC
MSSTDDRSTGERPTGERLTGASPVHDLAAHFAVMKDPRKAKGKQHRLRDIMLLTICAVICGADSFTAIEAFGQAKQRWLGQFLDLEHGIPSHDTIGRVFAGIDPEAFEECFLTWVEAACEATDGEVIAIDGKTLRRSHDRHAGKAALHLVSAWATANGLALGQVRTAEKSNEITAIPELLEVLSLSGCIVTIDAMGCQQAIAEAITDQGADYVLALKGNQGELRADTEALFGRVRGPEGELESAAVSTHKSVTGGHGRVETRRCWALDVAEQGWVDLEGWSKLRTVCMVEHERFDGEKTTTQQRFYISSLAPEAEVLLRAVRQHWHIENKLHWVLDVAFREDESRIRTGHAAQNMAVVRRLALNLLKQEPTSSAGIKNRRLRAGWDEAYLRKVLSGL